MPLRLVPPSAVVPVLQGPLRGRRWIAGSSNHGCWLGSYECAKQKVFSSVVRRGGVVWDLGANVGFYSLLASELVGPKGPVYCFEPLPRNLVLLRRHLEMNQVANCTVFDSAVGSSEGTVRFELGPNPSMGYVGDAADAANPLQLGGQLLASQLTVRTVRLDGQLASGRLLPPDVIKCDIEGGEYEALVGANDTLARHVPIVFLATHSPEVHASCCKLLMGLGYELNKLDGLPVDDAREILAMPQRG